MGKRETFKRADRSKDRFFNFLIFLDSYCWRQGKCRLFQETLLLLPMLPLLPQKFSSQSSSTPCQGEGGERKPTCFCPGLRLYSPISGRICRFSLWRDRGTWEKKGLIQSRPLLFWTVSWNLAPEHRRKPLPESGSAYQAQIVPGSKNVCFLGLPGAAGRLSFSLMEVLQCAQTLSMRALAF